MYQHIGRKLNTLWLRLSSDTHQRRTRLIHYSPSHNNHCRLITVNKKTHPIIPHPICVTCTFIHKQLLKYCIKIILFPCNIVYLLWPILSTMTYFTHHDPLLSLYEALSVQKQAQYLKVLETEDPDWTLFHYPCCGIADPDFLIGNHSGNPQLSVSSLFWQIWNPSIHPTMKKKF